MSAVDEERYLRREYVRQLVELSTSHQGGSVQLVDVTELDTRTELTFALKFGYVSPRRGSYETLTVTRGYRVTIELADEVEERT